jgi:sugar phosphate isomerase/epimerase
MEWVLGCTTRPFNTLSYEEAFARIGAAGYEDVAVFANEGQIPVRSESTRAEIAAVKEAAAAAGIRPSMILGKTQLEAGAQAALDDYRRLIDHAAAVGASWLLDLGTGNEEHYDAYIALMQQAAPYAESAGLSITMKPHGGISLTTEHLLSACKKVGHAAFAISYDPGNIIYYTNGDRRPESDVAEVAAKVSSLIVKDCIVEAGKPDVMVTPGDGLVDFAVVLCELIKGGFNGPSYVECVGGRDPGQIDRDIAFTLGYMKGLYAAL